MPPHHEALTVPLVPLTPEEELDIPKCTRKDFLLFDVDTKGPNIDIVESFAKPHKVDHDQIENRVSWNNFDQWTGYESLKEGDGLKLLAWVIFHFAPSVVVKQRLPVTDRWAGTPIGKWLTTDDIAFLLVTLENNINKWIRSGRILAKKRELAKEEGSSDVSKVTLLKKEVQILKGAKFPSGSGISGKEGQARFNAIKLFIQRNYFRADEESQRNNDALHGELQRLLLAEEMLAQSRSEGQGATAVQREEPAQDAVVETAATIALDALHDEEWNRWVVSSTHQPQIMANPMIFRM